MHVWMGFVRCLFECTKQSKLDVIITQQRTVSLHKPPNQYIMQCFYSHGVTNAENVL